VWPVNRELTRLMRAEGGVVTWAQARSRVPEHVLQYALRTGHLVAPFPAVLMVPELTQDEAARRRAALLCGGPSSALSHTSALAAWGAPVPGTGEVHLMTGPGRRIRVPGIVAHRRAGFVVAPPNVVVRAAVPVVRLERAVVDSWPLLPVQARRAPLLYAIGERLTTVGRINTALSAVPHLPERAELRALLGKIDAGCRSELELWGHDQVFTGYGMPQFRRQVPVRLRGRTVYLDLLHEATRTNIELDGARWHSDPQQRERDLRRDAALAGLGYLVVRFSHRRLTREPDQVRCEVLAVLASRSGVS